MRRFHWWRGKCFHLMTSSFQFHIVLYKQVWTKTCAQLTGALKPVNWMTSIAAGKGEAEISKHTYFKRKCQEEWYSKNIHMYTGRVPTMSFNFNFYNTEWYSKCRVSALSTKFCILIYCFTYAEVIKWELVLIVCFILQVIISSSALWFYWCGFECHDLY